MFKKCDVTWSRVTTITRKYCALIMSLCNFLKPKTEGCYCTIDLRTTADTSFKHSGQQSSMRETWLFVPISTNLGLCAKWLLVQLSCFFWTDHFLLFFQVLYLVWFQITRKFLRFNITGALLNVLLNSATVRCCDSLLGTSHLLFFEWNCRCLTAKYSYLQSIHSFCHWVK